MLSNYGILPRYCRVRAGKLQVSIDVLRAAGYILPTLESVNGDETGFFQIPTEKRETIVNAALAEFEANDFKAASLDRIVVVAGISKGGLYEYIASKEDFYLHCVAYAWDALYRFIRLQLVATGARLPEDILERFMAVSRIAIEWYLQHPQMLGLFVRVARLPRNDLSQKAQAVFEKHFPQLFADLDDSRLAFARDELVKLVKWLLTKTCKDVLLEIEAGRSQEDVRRSYLSEWTFYCEVLGRGIYRRD